MMGAETKTKKRSSVDKRSLDTIIDPEIDEYAKRRFGLSLKYLPIAVQIVYEFPLAYRAFEEAKKVLAEHGSIAQNRTNLGNLLRTEELEPSNSPA
jgi:hypothetical protein